MSTLPIPYPLNSTRRANFGNGPYIPTSGASLPTLYALHSGISSPTFYTHQPLDNQNLSYKGNITRNGEATWQCCQCKSSHNVSIYPGSHPLGALACDCPHKPCGSCSTAGVVKPFLPIEEPATVPTCTANRDVDFGTVCSRCGLSWRARESGRFKKQLSKMSSLKIPTLQQSRMTPGNRRLRKARSSVVMGTKRVAAGTGTEAQAEYAWVWFSGRGCTCGHVMDLSSLCFQIVSPPVDEGAPRLDPLCRRPRKRPGWSTTPKLEARGHGMPMIRYPGACHPNPLCSHPLTEETSGF